MSVRKDYDIFDAVKFTLSILIVSLHSGIVPDILIPVVRTAVPLFFIISSYLFFSKKQNMTEIQSGGGTLHRFISRNLKLYFFWTIVLLPLTVAYDIYNNAAPAAGYSAFEIIGRGIQRLLFSAFPASWYIIASVIALSVLYWIPKKYNKIMLIFSFILYLICCVSSNYYYLFGAGSAIVQLIDLFTLVFNVPHLSFLVAFIWMGIGKACAESKPMIAPAARRIGISISAIMLYLEYFAIEIFELSEENDCYMMLVPLCFFLFVELTAADHFKIKNPVTLRKMSTIIYCSHITVIRLCSGFLKYTIHNQSSLIIFAFTVFICLAESSIIFRLEKKKQLAWLRYSH